MTAHSPEADRLLVELVNGLGLTFPEAMRLRVEDVHHDSILVEDRDRCWREVPVPQRLQPLLAAVVDGRHGGYLLDTGGMTSRRARRLLAA